MRTKCIAATCLLLLLAGAGRAAPVANAEALAGLDELAAKALASWKAPGMAIAIVRDGEVVLTRGYGVRDSRTRAPMTEQTLVPIASMAKPFTSFSVGVLVDEGKISLDAPVASYVPGFRMHDPAATAGVTLRDVLSHRTGLPRHDWLLDYNPISRAELLPRLAHLEPSAPLRGRYQYNNMMYGVAALAVEHVARQPWEQFTIARILQPLGMTRTGFLGDAKLRDADQATGSVTINGVDTATTMEDAHELVAELAEPAGGLYSTAKDLSAWMLVHTGHRRLVQRGILAEMHKPQMLTGFSSDEHVLDTGYGLGWFTNVYRGVRAIDHGGNLPGFSTQLVVFPEQNLGIAVLVNQDSSRLPDAIIRTLADRFLGLPAIDWVGEGAEERQGQQDSAAAARARREATRVKGTQPSHRAADYAGTYAHPGYGQLAIADKDGTLTGTFNGRSSPLAHWHYDVFEGTADDPNDVWHVRKVQFRMDRRGRIDAAEIVMEGNVSPIVFKREPDPRFTDPAYLQRFAGEYDLGGERVRVVLSGTKLFWATESGQSELVPGLDGEFVHPRYRYRSIRFVEDATGRVIAMQNIGNDGIVEGKRVS